MEKQKFQNIESLAEESYKIMTFNKYIESKINLYKKFINLTKNIMKNFLDKNNSSIKLFDSYINEVPQDYENLKNEIQGKYIPKYINLVEECSSEISIGKSALKQFRGKN